MMTAFKWLLMLIVIYCVSPAYALAPTRGCMDAYGSGQCVPSGVAAPVWWMSYASNFVVVDNGGGYYMCQAKYNGESVDQQASCLYCPGGATPINGECPAQCQSPKEDDGQGGCKCPAGTVEQGEECVSAPDCSGKSDECSASCGSTGSVVVRFYCENSTPSDPSTQLFSGLTYACECGNNNGCPQGQVKVISTTGAESCRAAGDKKCPSGSYFGEYQSLKGCIEPLPPPNDPDEPPQNCIQGSEPVHFGSTLYCVPPPNSDKTKSGNDAGCPAGTTPIITGKTYMCKAPDGTGKTYIGGGGGSGSNSGSGIGSSDASIAAVGAVEQQLKNNAAADKASSDITNKELKDINTKLFAANQQLQGIKDKIPTELKSEEELPTNTAETLKTAMDQALERLGNAPIISAGADVLGSFPESAGSCPIISFTAFGHDISGDMHCVLFEDVRPQLEAVMLAFWSIFAVFVFRRLS